jgi:endonuclease YncB( thermonuclease family)
MVAPGRVIRRSMLLVTLVLLTLLTPVWLEPTGAAGAPPERATVVATIGSDRLVVQDDSGRTFRVQYVGVRGPVRSSVWSQRAADAHEPLTLGRRVRLEVDGRDRDEGYLLRHVYLDDQPLPIATTMLAYGLAVTAPYPLEHRHRALYLRLQRQAMADGVSLWRSGVLGPATAWRPPDAPGAGFLAAHPELHPFLDVLYTSPSGRRILDRLVLTSPTLQFRFMDGIASSDPLANLAVLSSSGVWADPRAVAAVIAHEGVHLVDFVADDLGLVDFDCYAQELHAHGFMVQVWAELVGPDGKPEPEHPWEETLNNALRIAQQDDLENYIRRSAGYQAQCARDRPTLLPRVRVDEPNGDPAAVR